MSDRHPSEALVTGATSGIGRAVALKLDRPSPRRLRMRSRPMLKALTLAVILLASAANAGAQTRPATSSPALAVGPQYDTTHVYVAPEDFDRFVTSFVATFGGSPSTQGVFTVTPTPSSTMSQLILTPVGTLSVFGFKTPVPYPFGGERTGYLVKDLDAAVRAARASGADVIVEPFNDPVGRDAVVQWPGGVNMQLYWHTTAPSYATLQTIPENRVYVSPDRADAFIRSFVAFSGGTVTGDDAKAPGIEIGRPSDTYRRVRIASAFGNVAVLVTDGHLPYPYGRELTGYETPDLDATLAKAKSAGARVLVEPYSADDRRSALVHFPGGYIAEIHATVRK
jgi:predicted enzyme related to lactoylglutathione lyase